MKLIITGGTGLIGAALVDRLWARSHSLALLTRQPPAETGVVNKEWFSWRPGTSGAWEQAVDGADGIINLAGEPIAAKRWSIVQKEKLRSSRIEMTRSLVSAIAKAKRKPKFFISASAVGYYGPHSDETLTEDSKPGDDFLARLCAEWEEEAIKAQPFGVRVALLRTGIVLAKGKGALAKMVPPFKMFVGGPLGSGKQPMPWIHIDDEVGLIEFLIDNEQASGAFNVTAPNPVTMAEFSKALGDMLNRPSWMAVPPAVLSLALGEMAGMLVTGQRAIPQAALRLGYHFKYPHLVDALRSLQL